MHYQIDRSNKIERSGDTALALSNDKDYTIRISAREKRKAIGVLIQRRKERRRKWVILQVFTVAVYYLIRELPPGERVTIDVEYTGHEDDIKNTLLPLLWRDDPGFDAKNITFGYVGKRSSAHKKALAVYRGKTKADRTLKADDLLRQVIGR